MRLATSNKQLPTCNAVATTEVDMKLPENMPARTKLRGCANAEQSIAMSSKPPEIESS
jgi:hypothetical protein